MILKSMSRQTGSYGQLLKYLTKDKAVMKDKLGKPVLIKHNVTGKTLQELERAFLENERNRAHDRKGSVKLYHDIISWAVRDQPNIDRGKIEAIAREYIRLRSDKGMFVGAIHEDKQHFHLHYCIGGTETVTGKGMRISKQRFQEIKEQLQAFEKERYPELTHSYVDFEKKSKYRKCEPEQQLEKRTGKVSEKEATKTLLGRIFKEAISTKDFYSKLEGNGLTLYERGGKLAGISGERNMRFKTLGFDESKLQELDSRQNRLNDLDTLRNQVQQPTGRVLNEGKDTEERIQELDR